MASRKEEKERLRAQRLAAEAAETGSERRRLLIGYGVAGLLAAAVVAGLIAVIASSGGGGNSVDACANAHVQAQSGSAHGLQFDCRQGTTPAAIQLGDLHQAAQKAGCQVQLNLADEGRSHVPDSTAVQYKTNPPTSGNHNPVPIADGAYSTPLTDNTSSSPNVRNFVHSMEHGRIEIHYSPKLPANDQLALKGLFDSDPAGMLLFPDPNMPYQVAVTAWRELLACPQYNPFVLDAIRDFRDQFRGSGLSPEHAIPINF